MPFPLRGVLAPTVALALTAGCDSARPGMGVTNGPPPSPSVESPALRTDLPNPGDVAGAPTTPSNASGKRGGGTRSLDPTATGLTGSDIGGSGTNAGTGGRDGGRGGNDTKSGPPSTDGPGPAGASGGTKSSGDIKVGRPRSPQ